MYQYKRLIEEIIDRGVQSESGRDNMPSTLSIFGHQSRYLVEDCLPMVTIKKVSFKNILTELMWFLRGDANIKFMVDNGCNIWNEDAYNYYYRNSFKKTDTMEDFLKKVHDSKYVSAGHTGVQYPMLWRHLACLSSSGHPFNTDQFYSLIAQIKRNPNSRRLIMSSWNVGTVNEMALPSCHTLVQFNVSGEYIDCQLYQRSADVFLGVPYNITSYCLLLHIVGAITGYKPRYFIHTIGDAHIYENHYHQCLELLRREPMQLPFFSIDPRMVEEIGNFYDFENLGYNYEDFSKYFRLRGYMHRGVLKGELSTGFKK